MEKVIVALRSAASDDEWVAHLCGPVADRLLGLGLPGLTLNLRDVPVRGSLMTLTTLDPPVQGLVSLWTDQHYGEQVRGALELLAPYAEFLAAYLVTESVPMRPPVTPPGERSPGLANIALLRRPPHLDEPTWLQRWLGDHTSVAIATQSTFGYVQNHVVRPLTPDAPPVSAIVEELFPIEAVGSLHAFFGAADDADLADRMGKMIASTSAFGANVNIDTAPTGRYVFRSPFTHG
ncbi:MAG: hypothetical protein KIH64_018230 [Mycobacterium sp.]|nr:hypothetical protein [Mycobacterium sp.]